MIVATKRPKLYALLFLICSFFCSPVAALYFDRAVEWVIDIDVSAGSRVRSLDLLVHVSDLAACESGVHCFFHDYPVLDVIFFLVEIVLARARVL